MSIKYCKVPEMQKYNENNTHTNHTVGGYEFKSLFILSLSFEDYRALVFSKYLLYATKNSL